MQIAAPACRGGGCFAITSQAKPVSMPAATNPASPNSKRVERQEFGLGRCWDWDVVGTGALLGLGRCWDWGRVPRWYRIRLSVFALRMIDMRLLLCRK